MKKCSIILVMVMMLTFGFGASAFAVEDYAAQDSTAKVLLMVDRTNAVIDKMIEAAIKRGDNLQLRYLNEVNSMLSDLNNINNSEAIIEKLDCRLESDLDRLIANLIKTTDIKASGLVSFALNKNVIVENEYILVVIGDKAVLVDPCRVRGN